AGRPPHVHPRRARGPRPRVAHLRARAPGGRVAAPPAALPLRALPRAPERRRRRGGDGGEPAVRRRGVAHLVALGDDGGPSAAGGAFSAHRGYHHGNGRRVDVRARRGRHPRAHPAPVGRPAVAAHRLVRRHRRDRPGVRARDREPHARGARRRGGARGV
ncbi:MAG: hypothetical protein AVDCRST_MAG40-2877, partial [uncultured Gemmatimonadaceae bacterium]